MIVENSYARDERVKLKKDNIQLREVRQYKYIIKYSYSPRKYKKTLSITFCRTNKCIYGRWTIWIRNDVHANAFESQGLEEEKIKDGINKEIGKGINSTKEKNTCLMNETVNTRRNM